MNKLALTSMIVLAATLAATVPAAAAPLTFGTSADFTSNFVQTLGDTITPAWDWDAGGFIRVTYKNGTRYPASAVGGGHDAFLYKPGGSDVLLDNFTVALDVRTSSGTTGGIAIYFGGGASLSNKLFDQFRINGGASAGQERVAAFAGRSMTNAVNAGGTNSPAPLGAIDYSDPSSLIASNTWYHYVFQVTRTSPTTVTATTKIYSLSDLVNPLLTDTRTGLSDSNSLGSWVGINTFKLQQLEYVDIDNVEITDNSLVPEPGTVALLGTGAFGFAGFVLRRRKTQ